MRCGRSARGLGACLTARYGRASFSSSARRGRGGGESYDEEGRGDGPGVETDGAAFALVRSSGPWKEHRTVVNGILWKLRTGSPWRDLPERYGPWQTCYDRFVRWREDGAWDRLLSHVQTRSDAVGEIEREGACDAERDVRAVRQAVTRHPTKMLRQLRMDDPDNEEDGGPGRHPDTGLALLLRHILLLRASCEVGWRGKRTVALPLGDWEAWIGLGSGALPTTGGIR